MNLDAEQAKHLSESNVHLPITPLSKASWKRTAGNERLYEPDASDPQQQTVLSWRNSGLPEFNQLKSVWSRYFSADSL